MIAQIGVRCLESDAVAAYRSPRIRSAFRFATIGAGGAFRRGLPHIPQGDKMTRSFRPLPLAFAAAALLAGSAAQAQIKVAVLQELSGAGATAGTNAKNGALLAIKEINAAGGILGKKIEATVSDTQSNPGVAKGLATKA